MSILEIKNLSKRFNGVRAVDDLSLEIEEGKITGIIGPNGSGKTTLVNVLSGMIPQNKGFFIINGEKVVKVKPHNIAFYGITRTFQDVRLFNQMTVLDNMLVVLTDRNVFGALFSAFSGSASGGEKHSQLYLNKAKEILEKVGLWEKKSELAVNLSYGQRKLLEIARALANSMVDADPDIFLLDEPFAGLFPHMIKIVESIVKELKEQGKTIILIEHNMNLIRELCDYVFVMDEGRLLAEGEPDKVLEERKVIEAYLGE